MNLPFPFTLVSKQPLIIHSYTLGGNLSIIKRLVPYLNTSKKRKIHFIFCLDWHITPERLKIFKHEYDKYTNKYPSLSITFLANDSLEYEILKNSGINSIICNQNAFLDENKYIIKSSNKKLYNAVMNAHMSPYKRIDLAKDVHKSCLITYLIKGVKESEEYSKYILSLPYMSFPQFDGSNWERYSTEQICTIYGQSRCGLILSAEEGACFAATEYLLCGLPVVTTPNIGGRDVFFDPEYVVWTEATPEAVAEAVQKAISLPISAQEIRERTIAKIKKVRETYCDLLSSLAREDGIERDFRSEWNSFFVNKMMAFGSDSDAKAVKYLKEQGLVLNYSLLNRLHTAHRTFRIWWDHLRGKK